MREESGLRRATFFLRALGCPNVRRGEGSDEWARTCGAYPHTPDLVAGPLIGGGDARDFYIDLIQPTGDWYVNPKAGNPVAFAAVERARKNGVYNEADLGLNFDNYYQPLNKKLEKYSGSRGHCPMVGIVMHIDVGDGTDDRTKFVHVDSVRALDRAFGLSLHAGGGLKAERVKDLLFNDKGNFVRYSIPIAQQLGFLLWIVEGLNHPPKAVLLLNAGVVHPDFAWSDHPVVKWMRRMATTFDRVIRERISSGWDNHDEFEERERQRLFKR
jgi:hypothetical protein